jgi:hypothetical protein
MTTNTTLAFDTLVEAARHGGVAALADYVTDDVELTQIDERTPPAAPAVHVGRDTLLALAESLEHRGVRTEIEDGFLAGDRGTVRMVCTYPDGKRTVEHALVTVREGRIARWSGVQAWDH